MAAGPAARARCAAAAPQEARGTAGPRAAGGVGGGVWRWGSGGRGMERGGRVDDWEIRRGGDQDMMSEVNSR